MSMHKKPLTQIEESGLRAHGLDIGTPSQLSDAFRQGVAWAQLQSQGELTGSSGTPSSKWAEAGEPDPHGDRYDCDRAGLSLGEYTDDELANAVFMYGNVMPDIQDIVSGKAMMPIVYLTAAKDRIRWLSRKLSSAIAHGSADGFPMQPVVVAELGVVRFKENRIVNYLIECISSTSLVLNDIAKADFTDDERMQFAQLLGYSVCGYCDLSYASEESKDRACELAAALVGGVPLTAVGAE